MYVRCQVPQWGRGRRHGVLRKSGGQTQSKRKNGNFIVRANEMKLGKQHSRQPAESIGTLRLDWDKHAQDPRRLVLACVNE